MRKFFLLRNCRLDSAIRIWSHVYKDRSSLLSLISSREEGRKKKLFLIFAACENEVDPGRKE